MKLRLNNILLIALYLAVFVLLNVGPCWAEIQEHTTHVTHQHHQHKVYTQIEHSQAEHSQAHQHHHNNDDVAQDDCCPESEKHCCNELAQKWPTLSQNSIEFDFEISSNKVYRIALTFLPMPDEHQVKPYILALRANPPPSESPSVSTEKKALKSIILLI